MFPTPIAGIGAGALSAALLRRLHEGGYPISAVISRTLGPAEALAATVGAPVASTDFADLPGEVRLIACCVPDSAVSNVAKQLSMLDHPWHETTVFHTAGALTSAVLQPLADAGAQTLSFHPVQSFTRETAPSAFTGIRVTLEGSEAAQEAGRALANALGAIPLTISPEARVKVHLAAAMASNFFVTLQAMAADIASDTGIAQEEAQKLFQPLVARTWENLQESSPGEALTGPIQRGDDETVEHHLTALRQSMPAMVPAYAVLATETIRLAHRTGSISKDQADRLLSAVQRALNDRQPPAERS